MKRSKKSKVVITRALSAEFITTAQLDSAERILAKLVAAAYARDHLNKSEVPTQKSPRPKACYFAES
jgi:hypothetical protein